MNGAVARACLMATEPGSVQLSLARQDVKERESSEDVPDAIGWPLQPAPTLVLD
jgi:hypothetical protein